MNSKSPSTSSLVKDTLNSALLITEVAVDLRGCYISEKICLNQLKRVISTTEGAVNALQITARNALEHAHKIAAAINNTKPTKEGNEIISMINKQLSELNFDGNRDMVEDAQQMTEKVRLLDKRSCDSPTPSWSNKSVKSDINEKYPESLSRESLIDLNTVVNLPPVPEDIFTSFSTKPTRSSSLSSLKSIRKVKMFLQRAENSDDDDSSDVEEHDYSKVAIGDSRTRDAFDDIDDGKPLTPSTKKLLGDITEETRVDD